MSVTTEHCFFCPNTETRYCSICKKWLCDGCRKDYWKRMEAFEKATEEEIKKVIRVLKERLGI